MANLAEGLIGLLRACGVETIYGVTGDAVFPFFDALAKQGEWGIRFVGATDETAAAFMASYHAKLTGRLGVCVASSGPGAANLVNGLADAYCDGAPVLAITGQVALDKLGTGAKQEINQQLLLASVTASSEMILSGGTAMVVLHRAIAKALRERTVTHVTIPQDLFQHETSFPASAADVPALSWQPGGFSGHIDEAVQRLQGAHNPLLLVGEGNVALREPVERLADVSGAAMILAQQAKGLLPDEHPKVVGGVGEAYLPDILQEVDCVVQIGTVAFEKQYIDPNVPTVQLVEKSDAVDQPRADVVLMGNLWDILGTLSERLAHNENAAWQEKISQEKLRRSRMIAEQRANESQPLHPAHVMTVLSEVVPDHAVIVCDIGAHVHWFDSYFTAKEQTVLISSHWRSLGAGVPGAIGAALAQPERKVLALVGDGGMLASLGVLCTAAKHTVPITVVVMNNRRYEIEQVRMEHQGMTPIGTDLPEPNFAAVAAGCGVWGRKVATHDELLSALTEALQVEGPALVDVHVAQVELPFLSG